MFVLVGCCFNFELHLESCHPILELRDEEGLARLPGRTIGSFPGSKRGVVNLKHGPGDTWCSFLPL